jgi:signal transduction histidine kinase
MKTINKLYTDIQDLENFIVKNKIASNENILLQVFTAICDVNFITDLTQSIKELIPHINIIGTTTDGEIIEDKVVTNSTILSFSIFKETKIATFFSYKTNSDYTCAQGLIKQFDKTQIPKVAISFADGLHINGENYLKAFNDYDHNLIIAGGLAGDNATFTGTIVFTEKEVLSKGAVVALLYNNNLQVNTEANFGWESLGKHLTVTKAKDNVVYEIDNIKAADIYAKYLGKEVAEKLPATGIEFPLIIIKDNLRIPRAVLGKNSDDSLVFAGNLSEGDKVTFGYGNVTNILNGGEEVFKDIQSNPAESIFIYSCMARRALMGHSIKNETKKLNTIAPLSGFFTYGEFYNNKFTQNNELLNQTMTILALSESTNIPEQKDSSTIKDRRIKTNQTLKALSHLVAQTSLELEHINSSLESRIKVEIQNSKEKDKQLFQQSRLAQMGEMISMIAHQWRQPLTAISSTANTLSLDILMDNYEKDFFAKQIDNIAGYSQHLSSTIDDFRNFFKQNKERQDTTLEELVDNTLSIISSSLESKSIVLNTNFNSHKTINTYPNELKQVVLNLIKNAEDILLEKKIKNPQITIKTFYDDDYYSLSIADNAGGVPASIIDKIFDPYFTTKSKRDGTGLGLYMSKTIAQEHCGGELMVSNEDDGAIFTIKLKRNHE